ncbi:MAG: CDP-alcohol phosphatidyltransferase family protein [Bacteroidaceae bacterium]|nr:CDP-alcohol phosphatidyltransferase family protein [Bacteroidaceae bacterium]MBP5731831.1 CDP-alcohol phosphatidyltransferase family protein [Bacteroidaceae bacterium]
MPTLTQQVLATMKSRDTEGPFELYVTRTPGYLWALLFKKLRVHPIAVTLLSLVIGCASGYFFYLPELKWNIVGMVLLIWANWYDCADGQLARMTGQKTQLGRILDGFAGDAWFFCIYSGIAERLRPEWGLWSWVLVVVTGIFFHARQCSLADYYRNAHLYFTGAANELERSADIEKQYKALRWWSKDMLQKFFLFSYASYTRGQENPTPQFQQLYNNVRERHGDNIPGELRTRYRAFSKPLMPLCQVLTFDARVGVLFLSMFVGLPWLYPALELTAFEVLRIYVNLRHERECKKLMTAYLSTR